MRYLSDDELRQHLRFPSLIEQLKVAFQDSRIQTPLRHHHHLATPEGATNTLLLMPAWQQGQYLGLKLVMVAPDNPSRQMASIQGQYLLLDALTGKTLVQCDARLLTALRTAAASALAAQILASPQCETMLLLGTGNLAPHLIAAHCSVRPIRQVWVWGRRLEAAQAIARQCQLPVAIKAVADYRPFLAKADLISCATMSSDPLVFGKALRAGQHIDLVGAYRPDMRESDDDCLLRAAVFVDCKIAAPLEAGDLSQPIAAGIWTTAQIEADLFDLCRGQHSGRKSETSITLFKSVGHALEDLAAAILALEKSR